MFFSDLFDEALNEGIIFEVIYISQRFDSIDVNLFGLLKLFWGIFIGRVDNDESNTFDDFFSFLLVFEIQRLA